MKIKEGTTLYEAIDELMKHNMYILDTYFPTENDGEICTGDRDRYVENLEIIYALLKATEDKMIETIKELPGDED